MYLEVKPFILEAGHMPTRRVVMELTPGKKCEHGFMYLVVGSKHGTQWVSDIHCAQIASL